MADIITDKLLADTIKRCAEELNNVVERARKEGLIVKYDNRNVEDFDITEFRIYRTY